MKQILFLLSLLCAFSTSHADEVLDAWFATLTQRIEANSLQAIQSPDDWQAKSPTLRKQLSHMLGLDPLPERTELNVTVTGVLEHEELTVEKLHFQPLPGLYVAGNLFIPRERAGKLPAVLYVCGHGRVIIDGVSYGNKVHYQHHGAWLARNGYVCLVIDTVQWGEFLGKHHGTYRHNMWWWANRGYTPAGTEAWTGMRAIDFLQSRPEVDPERVGITGRSGGGAYSWWIAALDERVKCAIPVAGITSMRNHIVDGCIEGHCDCMYMVNTHRWDFADVAALVAPRPLLISNTDKDPIFPLDGVVAVYNQTRAVYKLLDAEDKIGLQITEGGHKDTQELRIHAIRWLNRWLKNDTRPITNHAVALFAQKDLKVFDTLPDDEITTTIHEHLVKPTIHTRPANEAAWRGWKTEATAKLQKLLSPSQTVSPLFAGKSLIHESRTVRPLAELIKIDDERAFTHLRRRHQLLGRSIHAEHANALMVALSTTSHNQLFASGNEGFAALMTALLHPKIKLITLSELPSTFSPKEQDLLSPVFLGIERILTVEQLLLLVADQPNRSVVIQNSPGLDTDYLEATAELLSIKNRIAIIAD